MAKKTVNNTKEEKKIIHENDFEDQDFALSEVEEDDNYEAEDDKSAEADFTGRKYVAAVGRRKSSSAQVRVYQEGSGAFVVNKFSYKTYFPQNLISILLQPLKFTGLLKDVDISVKVLGGGKKGQAQAIRHGIARAFVKIDEDLKSKIKSKGWLTRDPRVKERKKPGLLKARRAPQWSKR